MQKTLSWPQIDWHIVKILLHKNFFKENVNLFPELTVGVAKWIFHYKEGILMETDPFSANLYRILNILL